MENKFTRIYNTGKWGKRNGKGCSGTGSSLSPDTRYYLSLLSNIINRYNIKSICDVGCGDWEFSKTFDWSNVNYHGIDCVESVINNNTILYHTDNISFEKRDISLHPVKDYDLVILKDVVQHWEDKDIIKVVDQLLNDNKYVFMTNGYKFIRDASKNNWERRTLDKIYHYHPVCIDKQPLVKYKNYVVEKQQRRAKQMILFQL
jgi:hypothetical protein